MRPSLSRWLEAPSRLSEAAVPLYHEAVELVGRRWTGAILRVLMDGPLRFSEIAQAVPELSDRLLSERMKELEARGIVERTVISGPPLRVEYSLSQMGRELEPALSELQRWANRWLGAAAASASAPEPRLRPRRASADATLHRPTRRPDAASNVRAPMTTTSRHAHRRRRDLARRGARHPLHPPVVHRHPRPAQGVLDQRHRARPTRSRAGWASTAPRSPASTRSRSRT